MTDTTIIGGGGSLPSGVRSDGQTPGGLIIDGALSVGEPNATAAPTASSVYGTINFLDTLGNYAGGSGNIEILQSKAVPLGGYAAQALTVIRTGSIAAADYDTPMVELQDTTASAQTVLHVVKNAVPVLTIGDLQSVTGHLSAVIDDNAKAVLTSIIATLTGITVASDDTT